MRCRERLRSGLDTAAGDPQDFEPERVQRHAMVSFLPVQGDEAAAVELRLDRQRGGEWLASTANRMPSPRISVSQATRVGGGGESA